jgi:hypothetical protein
MHQAVRLYDFDSVPHLVSDPCLSRGQRGRPWGNRQKHLRYPGVRLVTTGGLPHNAKTHTLLPAAAQHRCAPYLAVIEWLDDPCVELVANSMLEAAEFPVCAGHPAWDGGLVVLVREDF